MEKSKKSPETIWLLGFSLAAGGAIQRMRHKASKRKERIYPANKKIENILRTLPLWKKRIMKFIRLTLLLIGSFTYFSSLTVWRKQIL